MRYILSPLLAPPSIPPQRGEEKDKLLILEGVGGGVTLYLITSVSAVCIEKLNQKLNHKLKL
ncbi:MAG: hypothetical protein ACKO9G_00710 [Dolichospermum sp.]